MREWDYGGQRRNMEDDSMVGTLRAQAQVIWPVEREIIERRGGRVLGSVLDLACGTGEILRRLRADFVCDAIGVDLFAGHLRRAQPPVLKGDGYRLPFPDDAFDFVAVRHLLQALPDPVGLLEEVRRVLAPGGRLHLLVEDYAALFFDVGDFAVENHFAEVTPSIHPNGTDLYQGRRAWRHVRAAGFAEIHVDPVLVDNQRCDRDALADVFRYWRDGYAETLSEASGLPVSEITRRFDAMSAAAQDPDRWTGWLLFALSAM